MSQVLALTVVFIRDFDLKNLFQSLFTCLLTSYTSPLICMFCMVYHFSSITFNFSLFQHLKFVSCSKHMDFSGGSVLKNLPADVGDISSIPGKEYPLEKDPTGNPLQ